MTARSTSGSALVLGVLFIALVLLVVLPVTGLAAGYALHAAAQSGADAAALACAADGTVTDQVDARGWVYGQSVAVDPVAGPVAARGVWADNLALWPLRTVAFRATATGATCAVAVEVQAQVSILALLGRGHQDLQWTATAQARAYPGSGP